MLCTDCVHFTVMSDLVVCTILIYIVTTKDISKKREKSRSRGRKQARQEQSTQRNTIGMHAHNYTRIGRRRPYVGNCCSIAMVEVDGSVVMCGRTLFVMPSSFFNRFGHNDHIVCRVVTVVLATIIEFEIIDIKVRSMIILYRFY